MQFPHEFKQQIGNLTMAGSQCDNLQISVVNNFLFGSLYIYYT